MTTKEKKSFTKLLSSTSPEATEMQPFLLAYLTELQNRDISYWDLKLPEIEAYQTLKTQDAAYKGRLAVATAEAMGSLSNNYQTRYQLAKLLQALLRATLELEPAAWVQLFHVYGLDARTKHPKQPLGQTLSAFPVLLTLGQLEKQTKKQPLAEELLVYLRELLAVSAAYTSDAGVVKMRGKIQEILRLSGAEGLPTVVFADGDAFGEALNEFVLGLGASPEAGPWLRLLQLFQKASGAQPTTKFQKEAEAAVAAIGADVVAKHYETWLGALAKLPVQELSRTNNYGGHSYTYSEWHFLSQTNQDVVKGLLWTSVPLLNSALLHYVAELSAKCYRKIPGKGQLAPSLGNAGVWVLAQGGLPGVAHLSRLHSAVKQPNTQSLIGRYLEKAALELGMTPAELEDMAVPDFGLVNGRVDYLFGDYQAVLTVAGSKVELLWSKAGKSLKSAPTALKSTHADELRSLKLTQTQVQHTYTTQRERLDRGYITGRRIAWPRFRRYYLEHGVVGELARPLVWRIHHPDGSHHDALWQNDAWRTAQGEALPALTDADTLQLWHPVLSTTDEVLTWRNLLDERELRQPFKQVYREVYLLTPPEERTRVYSNRMAAHVLRQHQFSALARGRGWNYRLMGAYDKGYESDSATLELPAHGLQAQFWVSEVNADDAFNDTGIWNYVSTDQVRFVTGHGPVPLPEVPPLVFSEVMRDVDLFVGVASVGNDPLWRDNGGLVQYRNYWESYSFGELGEVAKNRKLALERLVPRLKIGKVSEIKGNFLEVKGKLRTYKIHLGSGNILMTPNDQYLCIVPDRSAKTASTAGVFLPFEGDAVLSIILSKALLLMDDDKITDDTIVRQIKQR
ncbi:DUF4132 domain-containing protein [Hymenobacter sp. BT186]|uniref:DUF4132 domain-containing protein n=1 Tax=Hymenobacter telluris TaxID=2816474 RepID=A0A939JE24_9BACT|nr:DUF4132 domain-containing protein [Hymenobacter telluris]MBO0360010.1 DUF4132 domain-containing protein [Hymenobacter telluris]MBW3376037.1 DUF4132 domain-containing protein [Hymenobacter norwichensis]